MPWILAYDFGISSSTIQDRGFPIRENATANASMPSTPGKHVEHTQQKDEDDPEHDHHTHAHATGIAAPTIMKGQSLGRVSLRPSSKAQ